MTIGNTPLLETMVLVPGQDFVHEIRMPIGESVPMGTTCELTIYDIHDEVLENWNADVTSNAVSWNVASEWSDTINLPAKFRIYVHYSDGKDFCWYAGYVTRA